MSNTFIRGAISCSATTSYTGSFVKLQALGEAGDKECSLSRVEFGRLKDPEISSSITSVTTTIQIPAGSFIEGPIVRFKPAGGDNDKWLAYFQ